MSASTSLARLSAARDALSEARSLDDVKKVRDQAEALRIYTKQQRLSLEMQNTCAEIKLRAERRAGEMLRDIHLSAGRPAKWSHRATISELGLSKSDSQRWQIIASLEEADFEGYVSSQVAASKELTTSGALKLAKQRRAQRESSVSDDTYEFDPESPCVSTIDELLGLGQRFGCIYADPPWSYGNQGTRASTDNHYKTMTVEDIAAMPIEDVAAEDAHLHLWTTNAFLFDSKSIMESWGFTYKSCFVWVKPEMGMGNYWRISHEFLLLGVRGRPVWGDRSIKSWGEFSRGKHSAKPEQVRRSIERVSPGPRLELFGRMAVSGWTVFGNQVERALC